MQPVAHDPTDAAEAAAEAVAGSYATLRARNPDRSHEELLRETLARRYGDGESVPPAERERMLERAQGRIVELVVQILRVENLEGWTDMMIDPSLDRRTRARIRSVVAGVAGETPVVA